MFLALLGAAAIGLESLVRRRAANWNKLKPAGVRKRALLMRMGGREVRVAIETQSKDDAPGAPGNAADSR
jgi:hypothetical protein